MNTRTAIDIEGTVIKSNGEDLTSFAGGMISYRFQRHSWITDDGRLHIIVRKDNKPTPGNMALALFSSNALLSGRTEYIEVEEAEFKKTGARLHDGEEIKSSSDAILDGNTLYVVYNTFDGDIGLVIFNYVNGEPPYWNYIGERIVYSDDPNYYFRATKPSIAKDSAGRIWVGFMVCDFEDLENVVYRSRVYYAEQASGYTNWVDTEFDNDVNLRPFTGEDPERSVRLLNYSTYIYAIVSSGDNFYHTYINGPHSGTNNWAQLKTIYTISGLIPDPDRMDDKNRAHFSAVVRVIGNQPYIHFVTNNGDNRDRKIVYASYQNNDSSITTEDLISFNLTTLGHYPQIAKYISDELYISYDIEYSDSESDNCRGLAFLEKVDEGSIWSFKYQLELPPDYCFTGPARSIIPELIPDDNNIPVHQQIQVSANPDVFKLVIYEVPPPTE